MVKRPHESNFRAHRFPKAYHRIRGIYAALGRPEAEDAHRPRSGPEASGTPPGRADIQSGIKHQLEVMETVSRLVKEKKISAVMAIHDLNLAGRF